MINEPRQIIIVTLHEHEPITIVTEYQKMQQEVCCYDGSYSSDHRLISAFAQSMPSVVAYV